MDESRGEPSVTDSAMGLVEVHGDAEAVSPDNGCIQNNGSKGHSASLFSPVVDAAEADAAEEDAAERKSKGLDLIKTGVMPSRHPSVPIAPTLMAASHSGRLGGIARTAAVLCLCRLPFGIVFARSIGISSAIILIAAFKQWLTAA